MLTAQVFPYCLVFILSPFYSEWPVRQELLRKELRILISAFSGLDLGAP